MGADIVETISLTLNGESVSVPSGSTILEAARRIGLYIPTLCHHDLLRPLGACRICQVEDHARGVLIPACAAKVAPGMVIVTDSPRVVRNRRNIIRLLLASHPESCLVCEKGNLCELRGLAARLGVGAHGLDRMPYRPLVMDLNPFLARDLSKCIMCAKCIRVDQEVVCEGVIDYNFRGFDAHPAAVFHSPLADAACTFCGSCLSVCPTGAIFEKNKTRLDHGGRRTESVCSFCACGCSIKLEHDHVQVRSVSPGEKTGSANGVALCVKGHFGHDYLSSPDRLRAPLIRTDHGFRAVSWDEALAFMAERLGGILAAHGPDALGFWGGGRALVEEAYLFQRLARDVFRTNNIDHGARAVWGPALRVLLETSGFAAGSGSFRDVEGSGAILLIGADPTRTAPVLGYHLKRGQKNGSRLIVVDPVRTKPASQADIWLRVRPGRDYFVLSGLIKVILEEDLADRQFIAGKTRNFEAWRAGLTGMSIAACAREAGVEEGLLREAARVLSRSGPAFVIFGEGLARQAGSADLTRLLLGLTLLTGNLGKDRSGFLPLFKEAGAQGALDMGLAPDLLPGQRPVEGQPGLDAWNMLTAAREGRLKGLFVLGENPAAVFPGAGETAAALGSLDFLVVQGLFPTETTRLAHLTLPAAAWAEKEGTAVNLERRVQKLTRAVPTPGDFPRDWEVFKKLAELRGHDWGYESVEDVWKEIETATPLYSCLSEVLDAGEETFWPVPGAEKVVDTLPHGIGHANGKAVFLPAPGPAENPPTTSETYPFILFQGHILQHLGDGSVSGFSRRLGLARGRVGLDVAPGDWERLGLSSGDEVRVISACGELTVPARLAPELPDGVAFLPACFPGARPNVLFPFFDPRVSPRQNLKHCPVRLERRPG
ncbi:MAG: molybdopterin-dependent oxidoreductase [Pseudomonadota bacterium]